MRVGEGVQLERLILFFINTPTSSHNTNLCVKWYGDIPSECLPPSSFNFNFDIDIDIAEHLAVQKKDRIGTQLNLK
jgi:hypothetical protein